jgi:predicted nucleotidyltransferase component of viral defense system
MTAAAQPTFEPGRVYRTRELWALDAQGFDVWFKGGTSLSKGSGLIERFSEDLDLRTPRAS